MMTYTVTLWQLLLIVYGIVGLVGTLIVFTGESVGAVKFDSYSARLSTLIMILFIWPFFVYLSMKAAAMAHEHEEKSDENSPENQ